MVQEVAEDPRNPASSLKTRTICLSQLVIGISAAHCAIILGYDSCTRVMFPSPLICCVVFDLSSALSTITFNLIMEYANCVFLILPESIIDAIYSV